MDAACAPIKCREHPNEPSRPYLPASQSLASDVDWPWNRIFGPNAGSSKVSESNKEVLYTSVKIIYVDPLTISLLNTVRLPA